MNDENLSNDLHNNWADSTAAQDATPSATPAAAPAAQPSAGSASMPMKQIVTIRLDVDTLAWFKSAGPGYQTRINQLLRDHMEAQQAQSRNAA